VFPVPPFCDPLPPLPPPPEPPLPPSPSGLFPPPNPPPADVIVEKTELLPVLPGAVGLVGEEAPPPPTVIG